MYEVAHLLNLPSLDVQKQLFTAKQDTFSNVSFEIFAHLALILQTCLKFKSLDNYSRRYYIPKIESVT